MFAKHIEHSELKYLENDLAQFDQSLPRKGWFDNRR